jgi:hypothetical protein
MELSVFHCQAKEDKCCKLSCMWKLKSFSHRRENLSRVPVVHACNPSYSGGGWIWIQNAVGLEEQVAVLHGTHIVHAHVWKCHMP